MSVATSPDVGTLTAETAFSRRPAARRRLIALAGVGGLLAILVASLGMLFWDGVGVWGNNIPVTWALDIVGYDWWIGIATGALLVSALLLLTGSPARGALNRLGQTIAVFCVVAAGLYPIVHLGRPWFFYWNLTYPNFLDLWPQYRSPLAWDAMAIISFVGISVSFWFIGMLPDLALLRDRASGWWRPRLYAIAALGWRGSAMHWQRWVTAQRIQAACGIVLVVSLQSGAAVMFAGTVEPGWHDTLQPITFLVSAAFSGIAAMAFVSVLVRDVFDLGAVVTARHLDQMSGWLLAAGLGLTYCHFAEFFFTYYGGDRYEIATAGRRLAGIYSWSTWLVFGCALLPIHLLWFGVFRRSGAVLVLVSLLGLGGMWMDHFMLLVVTLHHDFLPSSAHFYAISIWAVGLFVGTVGLFALLMLLFCRFLPVFSVADDRRVRAGLEHG